MRIGFYAPLKPPDHPVPSGDRQMARLLLASLRLAGHVPTLTTRFRAFAAEPDQPPLADLRAEASAAIDRVAAAWLEPAAKPDLLFTYHSHYKAPDLVGPVLAARYGLPYVLAEATLSARRDTDAWAPRQALVREGLRQAKLTFCFTARDRAGLAGTVDAARLADLPPFVDAAAFPERRSAPGPVRFVTLAMMRAGDKAASYRCLAAALALLIDRDWQLTVIGDGPDRPGVRAAFAVLPPSRLRWLGACPSEAVPALLADTDLMVWPGFNEAFGLCYLEAQACGVPVVAVRNAGTPSVIRDGDTGRLTGPEPEAFAAGLAELLDDPVLRNAMGRRARGFVAGERSLPEASRRIDAALRQVLDSKP